MIYTVTLSPALDKSYTIPGFAAGKVNRVREGRSDPGGKGINVSKTIRALGGQSIAMGIAGGQTGRDILSRLDAMGIGHDFVSGRHETRTNIKISDPECGTTTDINEPARLEAGECEALLSRLLARLNPGDIVAIAGRIDTAACDIVDWINQINEKQARVCLDTAGDALKKGIAAKPFIIKPNREEFEALLGSRCDTLDALAQEAMRLSKEHQIGHVVVSLGEEGALFASGDAVLAASAPQVRPVSTVGAGDAMCAALCFAIERGLEEAEGYRLALACGSAAVCCPGSQSPEKEKIEALLPLIEIRRIA